MPIKKTELKFSGKIEGSKFLPDNPQAFITHVQSYNGKGVSVTVKAQREMKNRSDQENRYYWGVVVRILAEEWGYNYHLQTDKFRVHSIIKEQFLVEPIEIKGKMLREEVSTAALSTIEFESLMTTIREWASMEFGIYIPLPNEVPFEY